MLKMPSVSEGGWWGFSTWKPSRVIAPPAVVVAGHAQHRVKQPVDGQLVAGDGVGDGIDQERHVVVDDADPHPPPSRLAAGGIDGQRDLALAAADGAPGGGTG